MHLEEVSDFGFVAVAESVPLSMTDAEMRMLLLCLPL